MASSSGFRMLVSWEWILLDTVNSEQREPCCPSDVTDQASCQGLEEAESGSSGVLLRKGRRG